MYLIAMATALAIGWVLGQAVERWLIYRRARQNYEGTLRRLRVALEVEQGLWDVCSSCGKPRRAHLAGETACLFVERL